MIIWNLNHKHIQESISPLAWRDNSLTSSTISLIIYVQHTQNMNTMEETTPDNEQQMSKGWIQPQPNNHYFYHPHLECRIYLIPISVSESNCERGRKHKKSDISTQRWQKKFKKKRLSRTMKGWRFQSKKNEGLNKHHEIKY